MNLRSLSILLALAALVSGCQSTSIRSAWFDTDFAGPPFRKVMVLRADELNPKRAGRCEHPRSVIALMNMPMDMSPAK